MEISPSDRCCGVRAGIRESRLSEQRNGDCTERGKFQCVYQKFPSVHCMDPFCFLRTRIGKMGVRNITSTGFEWFRPAECERLVFQKMFRICLPEGFCAGASSGDVPSWILCMRRMREYAHGRAAEPILQRPDRKDPPERGCYAPSECQGLRGRGFFLCRSASISSGNFCFAAEI